MEVLDSRRLTGRNVFDARPGAVLTARLGEGDAPAAIVAALIGALTRGLAALQWTEAVHTVGPARGEFTVMITAPLDQLYAATELVEWAAAGGHDAGLDAIAASAARERAQRPGLIALLDAAERAGLPTLVDDELVSLGYGRAGRTWPIDALPEPDAVDLGALGAIPVALVTGTNGKTTTSRLLARIARLAGRVAGNTTTDGICVQEQVIEAGDWTGPGAARTLLRRDELDLAILEVARGGLLRRGLEIRSCDAAIVTNVEHDHLGEYGVHDLDAMAQAKGLVAHAVRPDGAIVLGAGSEAIVRWAKGRTLPAPIHWFSVDAEHPVLGPHLEAGGVAWVQHDGKLVRRQGPHTRTLMAVSEAPLTFGGRAPHNIANVLGAAAVASALQLGDDAIVAGLRDFGSQPADNPGRARAWRLDGGHDVLLDFAHNRAGLSAAAALLSAIGRPTIVCFGMAGDRPDEDLRALGAALPSLSPQHVVIHEQDGYRRGRGIGEVPALLADGLRRTGFSEARTHFSDDEAGALQCARTLATGEEVIVLLLHIQREPVRAWLDAAGAKPTDL